MSEEFNSELFNYLENLDEIDLFDREKSMPLSEEDIFTTGSQEGGKSNIDYEGVRHTAQDIAGIAFPWVDAAHAVEYAYAGDYWNAGINFLGIIPGAKANTQMSTFIHEGDHLLHITGLHDDFLNEVLSIG